jgi:hypothetical protein
MGPAVAGFQLMGHQSRLRKGAAAVYLEVARYFV